MPGIASSYPRSVFSRLVLSSVLVPALVSSIISQLVPCPSSSCPRSHFSFQSLVFSLASCPTRPPDLSIGLFTLVSAPRFLFVALSVPHSPDHLTYPIRQVRSPATRLPLRQTRLLDSRPRRFYPSFFPRSRLTITFRASGPHVLIPIKRTQPSFLGHSYSPLAVLRSLASGPLVPFGFSTSFLYV